MSLICTRCSLWSNSHWDETALKSLLECPSLDTSAITVLPLPPGCWGGRPRRGIPVAAARHVASQQGVHLKNEMFLKVGSCTVLFSVGQSIACTYHVLKIGAPYFEPKKKKRNKRKSASLMASHRGKRK